MTKTTRRVAAQALLAACAGLLSGGDAAWAQGSRRFYPADLPGSQPTQPMEAFGRTVDWELLEVTPQHGDKLPVRLVSTGQLELYQSGKWWPQGAVHDRLLRMARSAIYQAAPAPDGSPAANVERAGVVIEVDGRRLQGSDLRYVADLLLQNMDKRVRERQTFDPVTLSLSLSAEGLLGTEDRGARYLLRFPGRPGLRAAAAKLSGRQVVALGFYGKSDTLIVHDLILQDPRDPDERLLYVNHEQPQKAVMLRLQDRASPHGEVFEYFPDELTVPAARDARAADEALRAATAAENPVGPAGPACGPDPKRGLTSVLGGLGR